MLAIEYGMPVLYKIRHIIQHTVMIEAALKNFSKSCST